MYTRVTVDILWRHVITQLQLALEERWNQVFIKEYTVQHEDRTDMRKEAHLAAAPSASPDVGVL